MEIQTVHGKNERYDEKGVVVKMNNPDNKSNSLSATGCIIGCFKAIIACFKVIIALLSLVLFILAAISIIAMIVMFFLTWVDIQVRVGPFLTSVSFSGWQMATGGGELGGMSFPILFVLLSVPIVGFLLPKAKSQRATKLRSNVLKIAAIVALVGMIVFRVGFEGFATNQLAANIDGFQYIRNLNFEWAFTAALIMNAIIVSVHIMATIWNPAKMQQNASKQTHME